VELNSVTNRTFELKSLNFILFSMIILFDGNALLVLNVQLWSFKVDALRKDNGDKDKEQVLPTKYHAQNVKLIIGICCILSPLTILGIPLALGKCPN